MEQQEDLFASYDQGGAHETLRDHITALEKSLAESETASSAFLVFPAHDSEKKDSGEQAVAESNEGDDEGVGSQLVPIENQDEALTSVESNKIKHAIPKEPDSPRKMLIVEEKTSMPVKEPHESRSEDENDLNRRPPSSTSCLQTCSVFIKEKQSTTIEKSTIDDQSNDVLQPSSPIAGNTVLGIQHSNEVTFSLRKKRPRSSLKVIDYSEMGKDDDSDDDYQTVPKKKPSETSKTAHVNSTSDLQPIDQDKTKPPKKRGRLSMKVDETSTDKSSPSGVSCDSEKGVSERPALFYRKRIQDDSESPSFFLPEGWTFYAVVRQTGKANVDLYYITSQPCVKLRSRQELLKYMEKEGLNYDPLKFFVRQHVPSLLKAGILEYYNAKTIVLRGSDKSVLDHVLSSRRLKEFDCPPTIVKKGLAMKTRSKESGSSLKTEKLTSKARDTSPELIPKNTKVAKPEKLSPDPKLKVGASEAIMNKKLKTAKVERLSPDCTMASEPLNRRSRSVKSEKDPSAPGLNASPEFGPKESTKEMIVSPLKKPRGRPRKSIAPTSPMSPLQPNSTLGERVKIRSRRSKKSSYFDSNDANKVEKSVGLVGLRRERKSTEPPPRSPYNLIQEDLFHDPWQLLIATIFLNSTSGKIAVPLALEFLKRWPTPDLARQAKVDDMLNIIEPLGFGRIRAAVILRFSHEYLTKDWQLPIELYGIGEYGNDSYKIFCLKDAWKKVESDDPMLMMYLNWRRATEHLRKRFLSSGNDITAVETNEIAFYNDTLASLSSTECAVKPPTRQSTRSTRKRLGARMK